MQKQEISASQPCHRSKKAVPSIVNLKMNGLHWTVYPCELQVLPHATERTSSSMALALHLVRRLKTSLRLDSGGLNVQSPKCSPRQKVALAVEVLKNRKQMNINHNRCGFVLGAGGGAAKGAAILAVGRSM